MLLCLNRASPPWNAGLAKGLEPWSSEILVGQSVPRSLPEIIGNELPPPLPMHFMGGPLLRLLMCRKLEPGWGRKASFPTGEFTDWKVGVTVWFKECVKECVSDLHNPIFRKAFQKTFEHLT